jgi:cyclophilin family peptidyl-prolyl cis-trans isomerase/HEAT repeat protein
MRMEVGRLHLSVIGLCAALVGACASLPPPPEIPVVPWEEKATWIMRLEDQRILRDPNSPAPVVLRPATSREPAILGPPQPSDLIRLLGDPEGRVRRRAALAVGRVGLPAGVEPLTRLLEDAEVEVRQMAAFALGLIGDGAARPALLAALQAPQPPLVQGRAAEALGLIGDRADATAIGTMVYAHVRAGVLEGIAPDEPGHPLEPTVEAVRLGVYALARLRAYDTLAGTVLDPQGRPVSRWWPLAYALQRVGDARAVPVLHALMSTPGRYTASFAVKGLAQARAAEAAPDLRALVEGRQADRAVVIQAVRALAAIGDRPSLPLLTRIVTDASSDATLRLEAAEAFGILADEGSVDLLLELLSDRDPGVRGVALRTLARVDSGTFLTALAGLEADRHWRVRVALADALGTLPPERALPRLTVMLGDSDARVLPAVIGAMASTGSPDLEGVLVDRLRADDFAVRTASAEAIAGLNLASALDPLIQAYRDAMDDRTYVARAAMLRVITQLDPQAARPLLEGALTDPEWAVRVHARELLVELGDDVDPAAIRPAPARRPADDPVWASLSAPRFSPQVFLETDRGTIEIELAILDAPQAVASFMALARQGFFNGVAIHRVVPDFVVQDGDPRGDGSGGPGYTLRDEINQRPYLRGTVGMALDWEDTGGSQFFVTHSPQPHLDGIYTVFGRVVNGMDVVDRLVAWDVVREVRIWDGVGP